MHLFFSTEPGPLHSSAILSNQAQNPVLSAELCSRVSDMSWA